MTVLKTIHKIFLARMTSKILISSRSIFGLGTHTVVRRSGIVWDLDLSEGIDLAIYLFGRFESDTSLVREGDTVLDIGANIGSHTLPLAKKVGDMGTVHAFEPTGYAYRKLKKNIVLNLTFVHRINTYQIMLVGDQRGYLEPKLYSSWPLGGKEFNLHEKHGGNLMSTDGAVTMTLDDWAEQMNLNRCDLIKIDVDGNEYSVLSGGTGVLKKYKPMILLELAPHVYKDPDDYIRLTYLLNSLGYTYTVPRCVIPDGSSKNVILIYNERQQQAERERG